MRRSALRFSSSWLQRPVAQANAALHRVVIVRLRWHQPTRDYVARRTAEGKSEREIRRCLTRTVARQLFRLLERKVGRLAAA